MTADILAQVAAMPLPEPFSRFQHEAGRPMFSADQLRAARLEAAEMVLAAAQTQGEPVAEVMSGWSLVWFGREPLAKICAAHPELRIGSKLYTRPPAPFLPVNAEMLAALREIAGMTYDSWTNGARAGEIASAAIASAEAASKGTT